jgi:hypothetical protein
MNVCKMSIALSILICVCSFISMPAADARLAIITIDKKYISAHEQCVMRAQRRYKYIKPALTACGISFVLGYFWYTSSSLTSEEIDKIRSMIADDNQKNVFQVDWFKPHISSIGGVAVELIGGALIIPPLSDLVGRLTGCTHVISSVELYDKEYTYCNALITQIARDMQMNIALQENGKHAAVGTEEVIHATNRLVHRMEKLIGFMRVVVRKFPLRSLRQEGYSIEKRLIYYMNELCKDVQQLLNTPVLNSAGLLALIVQFAQQYAQEMQRFSFLEQDAREYK